jgi:putative membrane protein
VQVATLLFNFVTKYQIWDEIRQGNVAVALSTGGIIVSVTNIMHFAISSNDSLVTILLWGGFGTILLLAVYVTFELFTPVLPVSEEIGKGNKAVGLLSFFYSLAFSFVIGASISYKLGSAWVNTINLW